MNRIFHYSEIIIVLLFMFTFSITNFDLWMSSPCTNSALVKWCLAKACIYGGIILPTILKLICFQSWMLTSIVYMQLSMALTWLVVVNMTVINGIYYFMMDDCSTIALPLMYEFIIGVVFVVLLILMEIVVIILHRRPKPLRVRVLPIPGEPFRPPVDERTTSVQCAICLEEYTLKSIVVTCPCGHLFHHDCLYTNFQLRSACPVCNSSIV